MAELVLQASDDLIARLAHESDPIKAVIELIWNAIDAEAWEVAVKIERGPELGGIIALHVEDDGHGISVDEVESAFGRIGDSWKRHSERSKNDIRAMNGTMGEGRLRAFALGGLLKTQFEEIETNGCTEGLKKRVKWPPIIGEKDLPGLEGRNRTLDGSADGTDLVIVFVFTRVEFTVPWLLGRWDVARLLKSLVGDSRPGKVENLLHLAFQLLHVMVTSGSRVRDEDYVAGIVADNQAAMAGGFVFPGPQLGGALPRPARPQRAVYQRQPTSGHLLRLLRVRPELFRSLSDQRGEFCDDVRDGGLGDPEKIGNNFFDHILPLVEQRDHDRFPQRQALRPSDSLIPGPGQDVFDTILKLIELFGIQSEGTMVTQRLLHRLRFWIPPPFYRCGEPLSFRRAGPKLETSITIRWRTTKARAGEFLITLRDRGGGQRAGGASAPRDH